MGETIVRSGGVGRSHGIVKRPYYVLNRLSIETCALLKFLFDLKGVRGLPVYSFDAVFFFLFQRSYARFLSGTLTFDVEIV